MKAMILAAGRGERMRPLTDTVPKPLLSVGGKPLIVWHILKLRQAGITEIIINHAWLGEKIERELSTGEKFGVKIQYSPEQTALETAGGIATALPKLGSDPFLVMNGDVWCDWNPASAGNVVERMNRHQASAWLLLVPNPSHHPQGDFTLNKDGVVSDGQLDRPKLTFSGIGIYQPSLFASTVPEHPAKLAPLLRSAMASRSVIGEEYEGTWVDIGTPERLQALDQALNLRRQATN